MSKTGRFGLKPIRLLKGEFSGVSISSSLILDLICPSSIDIETKKVEMTFRSGDLSKRNAAGISTPALEEGQKIDGTIKKIEDYGLFIEIEGSKLNGLCHKSEVCVYFVFLEQAS